MILFVFYILTIITSMTMIYIILYKTYCNNEKVKYPLIVHIALWVGTIIPVMNIIMLTYPYFWGDKYVVKSILFKKY